MKLRPRTREALGLLAIAVLGALLIAFGAWTTHAGLGTRVYVDYHGQQTMAAFAIPIGVAFIAVPGLILATRVWRWDSVRRVAQQHQRRPDRSD